MTGTPVMGVTPLAPLAVPPTGDAASASGSSTPRSVRFAVEPPRYSEEREGGRAEGGEEEEEDAEGRWGYRIGTGRGGMTREVGG